MGRKRRMLADWSVEKFMRWYIPERKPFASWSYAATTIGGICVSYLGAMAFSVEREKKRRQTGNFFGLTNRQNGAYRQDGTFSSIKSWWQDQRESQRTIFALIALNGGVFLGWKIPRLQSFMSRYFVHSIRSHPITMATSTFSHVSGIHLLVNMLALYSFGRLLHERMGREQFLAFYISCGLAASAGSHLVRSYRKDLSRSLGASGAIFGVAAGCAHNPNLQVSLIFLPFVSIPISVALPAMMVYDAVGLIKRWSTFDHAAHLSGAISGYLGYSISTRYIWPNRHNILKSLGYPVK